MVHGCVQNQECEDQIAWVDQRTIGMVDIVKQMWSLRRLLSEYKILARLKASYIEGSLSVSRVGLRLSVPNE